VNKTQEFFQTNHVKNEGEVGAGVAASSHTFYKDIFLKTEGNEWGLSCMQGRSVFG
jgi:hypothetical protein